MGLARLCAAAHLLVLLLLPFARSVAVPKFTSEIPYTLDDNWEPAIATDPNGGLYWASTRNLNQSACERCPNPGMSFRYSPDNGRTFGEPTWVCMDQCEGIGSQYDPAVAVDQRGRLYWAWMNNWNISFARSDDHGISWPIFYPCVDVLYSHECPDFNGTWGDKPWIALQGEDVYVFFNRAKFMVVRSRDGGETWERPQVILQSSLYFFPSGGAISSQGVICAAANGEPPNLHRSFMYTFCSENGGKTWNVVMLDGSYAGPKCPEWAECNEDEFLIAGITIAFDESNTLWALYANSSALWQPSRMYLRYSADNGSTWSAATDVSSAPNATHHAFPMLAAGAAGDVRVAWMDNRTSWYNTWYRETNDGGKTWSAEVKLSNLTEGDPWQGPLGFKIRIYELHFPYGDYGKLAIDSEGYSVVVWGEGPGWLSGGNVYFARQLSHS